MTSLANWLISSFGLYSLARFLTAHCARVLIYERLLPL